MPCAQCGNALTAWSDAAQALLCEACYVKLPTARHRPTPGRIYRLPPPRRPEPDEYQRMVDDVWNWMAADGMCMSLGTSPPVLVGRCPRCARAMAARFTHRPTVDVRFSCESGCDEHAIAAALGRRDG